MASFLRPKTLRPNPAASAACSRPKSPKNATTTAKNSVSTWRVYAFEGYTRLQPRQLLKTCILPRSSSVIADVALDFAQVVADNQSLVFSLAVRFLRDREGAEELAQDVFLQLYQRLRQIESPAHATAWLRRAICHRCIDETRKRRLRPRVGLESVPEPSTENRNPDLLLNERLRRMVG